MHSHTTTRRLVGAFAALALLATACGGDDDADDPAPAPATPSDSAASGDTAADAPAADGDATITIALGAEPTSLDPHTVDDGGERAVNDNIYDTLVARTADGELIGSLATDLPTQIDDLTWEFALRDGVTFHDGTAFTADAVVASVDRAMRLTAESKTDLTFYDTLAGAEAIDEHTVRITTTEPDGLLPARLTWLKIIAPSAAASDDLSDASNGTGPYRFVSYESGVSVELAANPDYWGDAPAITSVRFAFVSEAGTRLAGLKSGQYDLITNLAPNDVDQAPDYVAIAGQEHPILILDADEGITADPDVRLALNLAVDKQALVDVVYGGFAEVDQGQLLSPSIVGYNDDLTAYEYDPERAKQLIEDAGVAGQTITLVGESSGRWLNDDELVEAITNYWTEAGLQVDLQTPEFGAYLDILFDRTNRLDAIFVSSSNDLLDADRQLSAEYHMDGSEASNSDAELAALIDEARATLDTDARAELYQEAVARAYDNAYFVWLVNNQDIYGLSEDLQFSGRVDGKLLVKEMSLG